MIFSVGFIADCCALAPRLPPAVQRLRTGLWEPTFGATVSGADGSSGAHAAPRTAARSREPSGSPAPSVRGIASRSAPASRYSCAAWRQTSGPLAVRDPAPGPLGAVTSVLLRLVICCQNGVCGQVEN